MNAFITFTIEYHRIIPPTIFLIGIIGNLLSLVVFCRRVLRKSPCGTYFFGLANAHLNNLIFGLLSNYLIDAHGIDLITRTIVFCRIRFLILHSSLVLSSWFIVLAGIDRFFISSPHVNRRYFSSLKRARIAAILSILICFIFYGHILVLFTIEQTRSGPVCYAQSGSYRIFYDFLLFATFSFTPPIIMIIVGLATLSNTRQTRRQIEPLPGRETAMVPNNTVRLNKREHHFIKMSLVQLIFFVLLTFPIAIQKLYDTFTNNLLKSSDRLLIENFFRQFVRTLVHINSAASFYL